MNIKQVINFLLKFEIDKRLITKILKDRVLFEKNKNIFLVKKKFENTKVFDNFLLYIDLLNKKLPSTYFLNLISNCTTNKIFIKNLRDAIKFTYSKDLEISLSNRKDLQNDKYYLLLYRKKIIGICEVNFSKKVLKNVFNIGQYLKEN